MRLVFAHDHRFLRGPSGELFSVGSFPRELWDRYLEHFHSVTMIARDGGLVSADCSLARADRPELRVELVTPPSFGQRLGLVSGPVEQLLAREIAAADAVIARLPSDIGLLAVTQARRANKPYLVEVVGCPRDGYGNHGSLAARLYAPVAAARMARAVAGAPFALYVTEDWLQRRYPTRGQSASASNVAIDTGDGALSDGRQTRLAELTMGRRPRLGTVASLSTASKGLQTAIPAIGELARQGIALDYAILGAGDSSRWVALAHQHNMAGHIHFEGTRKAGTEVLEWLDGIDIYLQPSFQEGLPRATIEAMSRGCACIGSTAGGIPELLPPDRLHAPGDVVALAAIVAKLVDDAKGIVLAATRDRRAVLAYNRTLLDNRRRVIYAALAKAANAGARRIEHDRKVESCAA